VTQTPRHPTQLRVDDFAFDLPDGLIADTPVEPRDAARLLVYDRRNGQREHRRFSELCGFLEEGDLLVLNDTRVLPHRLFGRRETGGRVECLILERHGDEGRGYVKPARKVRPGDAIPMEGGRIVLHPIADLGAGMFRFRLEVAHGSVAEALEEVGRAPLPPYIRRDGTEDRGGDRARYQTVFATAPGAIAAPTAGLHFTPELLAAIEAQGVAIARVTLHVGEGTFAPLRVDGIADHVMHEEAYALPEATARAVAETRARGGRVIAVGTTAARTLETCAVPDPRGGRALVAAQEGRSDIFIYPGVPLRVVDALVTNFHLPRSTLVMLVAAMIGRETLLEVYGEAIALGYRFYSFGDAMLIV